MTFSSIIIIIIIVFFTVLTLKTNICCKKITVGILPITRTNVQDLVESQRYLVS